MLENIKKLFNKKTGEKNALSDFFINSSSRDRKKIFKKAGQAANKDQNDLMKKHSRISEDTVCRC